MADEIAGALADRQLGLSLERAMTALDERRSNAFASDFDFEAARARARAIKEEAICRNDELLDEFERSISGLGGHVFRANTARDARLYISRLARNRGVRLVVKAKSMTSEEIHLNEELEARGVQVVETDLGERIIQLAGEHPSHIIVPAIHKSKQDIARLLADRMGMTELPTEAEDLTRLVRASLRELFLTADMGITGANFAVADTGTLVLVENEGNIRLCTQIPPLHVAIVGREKIVPRLSDAGTLLKLLPPSATGQDLSSYTSFITGAATTELVDFGRAAPMTRREFHVVVLDNGRSSAARDPELVELLYCIRCGACLNACAPYRQVGGHVYGSHPYHGGIGCAWSYVTEGHSNAKAINGLCTTCSRCTEVCPLKIDIPWLNTVIKERNNREFGARLRDRMFARADLMGTAFSPVSPLLNRALQSPPARRSFKAMGIDPQRPMPQYERVTFTAWFREHQPPAITQPTRRVALFVDCFVNHNLPSVGKAAVEVLERAGIEVTIAHNSCCGRPSMSQGMLDGPRRWAIRNLRELSRCIDSGHDVVCIEPSCLSALRDDYRRLLERTAHAGDAALTKIETNSYDITEYLLRLTRQGLIRLPLRRVDETYIVHAHCHQKSLGLESTSADLLRLIPGARVKETAALCCGMVGSFGYKSEYSQLSLAIGGKLFSELAEQDGTLTTCGISCRTQIEYGTGRKVHHPVEVIRGVLE